MLIIILLYCLSCLSLPIIEIKAECKVYIGARVLLSFKNISLIYWYYFYGWYRKLTERLNGEKST